MSSSYFRCTCFIRIRPWNELFKNCPTSWCTFNVIQLKTYFTQSTFSPNPSSLAWFWHVAAWCTRTNWAVSKVCANGEENGRHGSVQGMCPFFVLFKIKNWFQNINTTKRMATYRKTWTIRKWANWISTWRRWWTRGYCSRWVAWRVYRYAFRRMTKERFFYQRGIFGKIYWSIE